MEYEDTIPHFRILDKLGGWPLLLEDNWNEDIYQWNDVANKINQIGVWQTFPFAVSVAKNSKKKNKKIIRVSYK